MRKGRSPCFPATAVRSSDPCAHMQSLSTERCSLGPGAISGECGPPRATWACTTTRAPPLYCWCQTDAGAPFPPTAPHRPDDEMFSNLRGLRLWPGARGSHAIAPPSGDVAVAGPPAASAAQRQRSGGAHMLTTQANPTARWGAGPGAPGQHASLAVRSRQGQGGWEGHVALAGDGGQNAESRMWRREALAGKYHCHSEREKGRG